MQGTGLMHISYIFVFIIYINGMNFIEFITIFFCLFAFSRATPVEYGGSQARGLNGAVAAGLWQSNSNAGSELSLRTTPQLMSKQDP